MEMNENKPLPAAIPVQHRQLVAAELSQERRTTEGSFHSAKEEQTAKLQLAQSHEPDVVVDLQQPDVVSVQPENVPTEDLDDIGSPSDESTPDRPLLRKKSSLNFASLPAREPLKNNIDDRLSRVTQNGIVRTSAMLSSVQSEHVEDDNEDDSHIEILGHDDEDEEEHEPTKPTQYRSTQRLQERIDMLGKTAAARSSKSIPSAVAMANSHLRQSEAASKSEAGTITREEDDDWIKPLTSVTEVDSTETLQMPGDAELIDTESQHDFDLRAPELIAYEERMRTPVRMSPSPGKALFGHAKSHSTATLASPNKTAMAPPPSPAKSLSVSYPSLSSTTPQGSPKRKLDGTLSASKSKLHSLMKTAKGLFTSSAGVSAAAKLETLSPDALRMAASKMPGLYPSLSAMLDDKPLPASPREGRQTRSSTERQKDEKMQGKQARVMQKMNEQLENAREKERQKATTHKEAQLTHHQGLSNTTMHSVQDDYEPQDIDGHMSNAPALPSKSSRPSKPVPSTFTKPKPVPVSIKLGPMSQRLPVTTQTLAANLQETLTAGPKRPGLIKKASATSIQSSAAGMTSKGTTSYPAKPKALIAAERKREQDEREAQRKMEQKKEMDRRRAAQQEEAKKEEQRQRAEAERKERERVAVEQQKRQAQQQAIERKRLENARKAEQQRDWNAETAPPNRPPSRLGSAQPLSRSVLGQALPTNPARPAKRPLEDALQAPPSRPTDVQVEAKRRKTEDEAPRPTLSAAPIRQSNLGKKPSIFNHNLYAPAQQQPPMGQFPQPPNHSRLVHANNMAQYGNGAKIPFAEAPNPPAHATRTPASVHHQKTTLQLVKSSPHYPHGEAIHLPEIPTDSEDEDSENEGNAFPIPDWATPGHLTEQLVRQEGLDGDAVFGPIAPLKMEEIFAKGNKERLKRMRDRTSSANWAMSGDGLTLEEIRVDREQRERMRVEGGWRFGNH